MRKHPRELPRLYPLAHWNDPDVHWVCEEHPDKEFPHDDCAGPGMPDPKQVN